MPALKPVEEQTTLQRRRHAAGLYGWRIAQLVGIHPHQYAAIERGQRRVSPAEAAAIDAVLLTIERACARAQKRASRTLDEAAR